jgi:CheY-like chemotaxis protein
MARVLIVDDDMLYRGLLVEVLRLEGFHVQEAHSQASALRTLETHPPFDVILCDLQMDGMDGMELLKFLRAEHAHIPVVVVSAHNGEEGIGRTARDYATAYLSKPFNVVKLISTIRNVLSSAQCE